MLTFSFFLIVVEYEGPDAMELRTNTNGHADAPSHGIENKTDNSNIDPALLKQEQDGDDVEEPEESSDDGSEDDYVAEEESKKRTKTKVRVCAFYTDREC